MGITGHLRPGRPKKTRRAHISSILTYRRYVVKALVGGRDQEDDESYRYRINLKLQSKSGSAEGDLRLAILQIPGVQDIDFERQAGTYNAYVYGVAPTVPASLLQLVQEQIDQRTAYPLVGLAVAYLGSPSRRQTTRHARGTVPRHLAPRHLLLARPQQPRDARACMQGRLPRLSQASPSRRPYGGSRPIHLSGPGAGTRTLARREGGRQTCVFYPPAAS